MPCSAILRLSTVVASRWENVVAVAEKFSGAPGVFVPLHETLRGFKEILSGAMDDYPEAAFFNAGTIDDVKRKAEELQKGGM